MEKIRRMTQTVERFPAADGNHLSKEEHHALRVLLARILPANTTLAAGLAALVATDSGLQQKFEDLPTKESATQRISTTSESDRDELPEEVVAVERTTDDTVELFVTKSPRVEIDPALVEAAVLEALTEAHQDEAAVQVTPASYEPESSIGHIRPKPRPEYVTPIDTARYENWPVASTQFLTQVVAAEQFITMSEGALVKDLSGKVIGVVPAGEIGSIYPSAGYVDTGHVTDGFSKAWTEKAQKFAAIELGVPPDQIDLDTSVWVDLQSGAKKLGTYPDSIIDMTLQFAQTEVPRSGLSRLEYLKANLYMPNERMPQALKDILEFVALGIPGEESRFNDTVISAADARTAFQILPSTWEGMGYPPFATYENEIPPYTMQVQAFGQHLGNIYDEIHTEVTTPQLARIRALFSSDEEYYQYFLTPLILNAYNAGAGTMRAAVDVFLKHETFLDLAQSPAGYDVFYKLSQLAYESDEGPLAYYKDWARRYPVSVTAYANVLNTVSADQSYTIASR